MTWFRLDDGWLRHPKHRAAGLKGRALWIAAGTWSSEQLTDGKVPKEMLPVLAIDAEIGNGRAEARRLVEIGLWDDLGDAWQFHDWHEFQPSRADVLADRAKREASSILANHTRWHVQRGRTDPTCPHCITSGSDSESDSDRSPKPDPMHGIPPARPDPTLLPVTSEQQQSCVTRAEPKPDATAAAPPATGKDHRTKVLEAAIVEVATRRGRYEAAQAKSNPAGWIESALAGIRAELVDRHAYERIRQGATVDELANLIQPRHDPDIAAIARLDDHRDARRSEDRCTTCLGAGHTIDEEANEARRCPACNPDPLQEPTPA